MALTAQEEALVRQLLDEQAAILSLAGSEATILSKLGATKVTLSDLTAVSTVADADLLLMRQGTTDKSLSASLFGAYAATSVPSASQTVQGKIEIATDAEVQTGTDTTRAITPSGLTSRTATDARTGIVELATDAEAQAGTDGTRAVTPDNLGATVLGIGQSWQGLTGSRAFGTVYTNATGRAIAVSIRAQQAAANASIQLLIAGIDVARFSFTSSVGAEPCIFSVVPPGATYQIVSVNFTINVWSELR